VLQLSDVKSRDKTMTLMHYLVEFIRTTYPKLRDFHEELDIAVTKGGEFEHSEQNNYIIL